jgi:very-short-patch-repair endonuclease
MSPVEPHRRSADALIAAVAGRQDGVASSWQLISAGVSRHQVAHRLADGRLTERHRGIYQVGPVLTERGKLRAALLAYHPLGTLSHAAASFLYALRCELASGEPWVTVPPGRVMRRPGLSIVRSSLEARDIRIRHGFRVTSPPRTVLDCARFLAMDDLEQMVADAHYRGIAREAELLAQLDRNPGKPGNRKLRAVLEIPGGAQRLRSAAEREMLRLLREHATNGYECNATIHGYEVDFLWRDLDLVLEVDGYDAHSGRRAFERDRVKIAALQARGVTVMPATGRRIRHDPTGVIEDLEAALRAAAVRLNR